MKSNVINVILIFFFLSNYAQENKDVELFSPDKRIHFTLNFVDCLPKYGVFYDGKMVLSPSTLNLSFENGTSFNDNLDVLDVTSDSGVERYSLLVGKSKFVEDKYKQVTVSMLLRDSKRKINLEIRAFNDGLAFRYTFPRQDNWLTYKL